MKKAIFSDLHVHKHRGLPIYEDIAVQFLYDFTEDCLNRGIQEVYFLGDWFEIKNKLFVPSYVRSTEALAYMVSKGLKLTFVIGNHDMVLLDNTEYSIIKSFMPYGKVINDYEWIDNNNTRLHFLSYTNTVPDFNIGKGKNILFGHLDVNGFMMDDIVCKDGFNKDQFKQFDLVLSGHFHKHQVLGNIVYSGSPYQIRYSERHDIKGYILLDTDKASWEFVEYKTAPTFVEETVDITDIENVKGKFVRIKTNKSESNLDELKQRLLDAGAISVEFSYESNKNDEETLNIIQDLDYSSVKQLAEDYFDSCVNNNLFDGELTNAMVLGDIDKTYFLRVFDELRDAELSGWKPEK
jgi:DNA repair exonuclease SbcCD nuclease subunit